MDVLNNLAFGFSVAVSPQNILYCFIGVLLGTLVGVLPGIGPIATIAMLLPATYSLDPTAGLIMLAGIYYGAQYGGSTTAILVNLPGEASAVVTCLDGHQMARRGHGGAALSVAAIGSFVAGSVGVLLLALLAPTLTRMALAFGPAEYFSLMTLGLVGAVALASGSMLKALAMTILGLIVGLVGLDSNSGLPRFDFDLPELYSGIEFTVVAMGLFGLSEIAKNLETTVDGKAEIIRVGKLMPTREEARRSVLPILRGTGVGAVLGVLPGAGVIMSSFTSYALEKRISRHPEEFGRGAIEGVAGPESANNAAAQTSFIPTLTLGIPGSATMALMLGAMMLHDIQPGPQVMTSNPDLFWGLIASMWIGNAALVVLNLPMVGLWLKLLQVPYGILFPAIALFCCVGVYSLNTNGFDLLLLAVFTALGYVFHKLRCEPAPFLLGLLLGPLMEENFRRTLLMSHGDPALFFTQPISLGLLVGAALLVTTILFSTSKKQRVEMFEEQ